MTQPARLRFLRARSALGVLAGATLALILAAQSAAAVATTKGYDISYPQCGSSYPSGQAFGVVGVNGGTAKTPNPCLSTELSWAAASPGIVSPPQPPVSFYLNTADPGPQAVDTWPKTGDSARYGSCDGSWSTACANLYGQQRAQYSFSLAQTAAQEDTAAGFPSTDPAMDPWWIDVETANTWAKSSDSPRWAQLNIAALQGFVSGLQNSGVTSSIGFYSTGYQWGVITGLDQSTSPQYFPSGEPNWLAGGSSLNKAQRRCGTGFTGANVILVQYPNGHFDGDYRCP